MKIITLLLVLVVNAIGLSSFVHAGHCGGSHASDTAQNQSKTSMGEADARSTEELIDQLESEKEQTGEKTVDPIES
tara:strand:- start:53 stop:280 length:228 start_codon:yes stop_codon:yes gene_type:complete